VHRAVKRRVSTYVDLLIAEGVLMGEDMLVNGRQWLCTTAASICIVSCIVSLFTIAFIAIDRYLYICWNG